MDETTNGVIEATEPVAEAEDIEGLDSEAEAMWDDDNYDDFADEADSSEAEADQPEAEATEETTGTTEQAEQNETAEDADQYLELKHFDEVRKVGKEEAKTLAQMGMDYPRVKGKLAEANIELDKLRKYEGFLNELKGDYKSIEDLMIDTRARIVADKENIPIENARQKVANQMNAPKKEEEPKESAAISSEKQSLTTFTELYPDIKAKDIPKEVWDDMKVTHSLVASWARYQGKTAQKENQTLKQNEKNKNRSTGSMKSSGTKNRDEYDSLWYEDDY